MRATRLSRLGSKADPDTCDSPRRLPGRFQVGFDRHQAPRPRWRGLRGRSKRGQRLLGVRSHRSLRRTRTGPCTRRRYPPQAVWPDPCRARVAALNAATSDAPMGRRSPSLASSSLAWSTRSHPLVSGSDAPDRPCVEQGVKSCSIKLSHATAQSGRSLRPTGATEVASELVTQKPQNFNHASRHTVHRWTIPSGPAGKPEELENVDEPDGPHAIAWINELFVTIIGMFGPPWNFD